MSRLREMPAPIFRVFRQRVAAASSTNPAFRSTCDENLPWPAAIKSPTFCPALFSESGSRYTHSAHPDQPHQKANHAQGQTRQNQPLILVLLVSRPIACSPIVAMTRDHSERTSANPTRHDLNAYLRRKKFLTLARQIQSHSITPITPAA